ncbi:hypothetical protein LguiA_024987 [Lonicera macranthoides]
MNRQFNNNRAFATDQEDYDNSPENSADLNEAKMITSTSSNKKSRRSAQKRVVSVPIRDVEGSRFKGETSAPPSDSWAWRKYGQKPIKGSPYPRGYYRCSSSKGCPARKQVERSRVDPTMLVVTYSCEHNHPWPASRNNHRTTTTTAVTTPEEVKIELEHENPKLFEKKPEIIEPEEKKFSSIEDRSLITDEFGWFSDLESTSSTLLESPLLGGDSVEDADMAMIFSMREEDESLFADLEELPECSVVFRRVGMDREEERRRCRLDTLA